MCIRNGARPLWQEMHIKCVAAVANSRSGTSDGERGAELHQLPSFSTVPPSPAKRVCVPLRRARESASSWAAFRKCQWAWAACLTKRSLTEPCTTGDSVRKSAERRPPPYRATTRLRSHTHTGPHNTNVWIQTSTVACYTLNLRRVQSCHSYTTHLVARIFALMVCLLV